MLLPMISFHTWINIFSRLKNENKKDEIMFLEDNPQMSPSFAWVRRVNMPLQLLTS